MILVDLFFGRSVAGRGDVTNQEWQSFLDDTVTANLPNGYTVLDAQGAWMNPVTGKTIHEASLVVQVGLPDGAESLAAVNRIRTDYQVRFHQQSVGMMVTRACGSF
jgi:hypothetical protein